MRVALAQINSIMGDFAANKNKILQFTLQAQEQKCDLVIFPELALFGYSPGDLLERPDIIEAQLQTLVELQKEKPKKIASILGAVTKAPTSPGKPLYNSAVVMATKTESFHKELLPNYDVFDESRYFRAGKVSDHVVTINKKKVLILVCEDMWAAERNDYANPLLKLKTKFDFVVSINASPFTLDKRQRRLKMAQLTAQKLKCPVIYVNQVGGQDEVIFDGGSFAMDAKGKLLAQAPYFKEHLTILDLKDKKAKVVDKKVSDRESLRQALVLGIRDFAYKNNLKKIHLGLSGGIDSAVALCLAVEAVGAKQVTAIALPGPYSAPESFTLAQKLAKNVDCEFHQVSIQSVYEEQLIQFEKAFGRQEFGVLHENLQARIRGNTLMMFANFQNSLLLATSNKSEIASGYATLYGDMCGGLAPLGDLLKLQVYELAQVYKDLIPSGIITRPPTAELRPNQKDQDSLPPYDELDASVQNMVTLHKAAKTETDSWLLKKIAFYEFKRWQSPPILKVSEHAFGHGRRFPITHRVYKDSLKN